MDNIRQLLELNIEIEGLLRVAQNRQSETVHSLLLSKSKKFVEILNASLHVPAETGIPDVAVATHTTMDDSLQTAASDTVPTNPGKEVTRVTPLTANATQTPEDMETVLEADIDITEEEPSDNTPAAIPPTFVSEPQSTVDIKAPTEGTSAKTDFADEPHPVIRVDEMIQRKSSRDLKKAFSLNDRFRYIREIFNNDPDYFDETVRNLEMLSNLDEVYEYLLSDLGLSHEDDTVKDFLAIIYNHFNA